MAAAKVGGIGSLRHALLVGEAHRALSEPSTPQTQSILADDVAGVCKSIAASAHTAAIQDLDVIAGVCGAEGGDSAGACAGVILSWRSLIGVALQYCVPGEGRCCPLSCICLNLLCVAAKKVPSEAYATPQWGALVWCEAGAAELLSCLVSFTQLAEAFGDFDIATAAAGAAVAIAEHGVPTGTLVLARRDGYSLPGADRPPNGALIRSFVLRHAAVVASANEVLLRPSKELLRRQTFVGSPLSAAGCYSLRQAVSRIATQTGCDTNLQCGLFGSFDPAEALPKRVPSSVFSTLLTGLLAVWENEPDEKRRTAHRSLAEAILSLLPPRDSIARDVLRWTDARSKARGAAMLQCAEALCFDGMPTAGSGLLDAACSAALCPAAAAALAAPFAAVLCSACPASAAPSVPPSGAHTRVVAAVCGAGLLPEQLAAEVAAVPGLSRGERVRPLLTAARFLVSFRQQLVDLATSEPAPTWDSCEEKKPVGSLVSGLTEFFSEDGSGRFDQPNPKRARVELFA
eukprot:TRINITY_DN21978_c0_g1_i1.p1 TRINITY_DN21978_c0_g1~~TRINITY_DN21978_c0_g1_i1.p1  ORF type:complete len:535 (+),score=91.85 TRINITY_DN21978_c0_g1_i1:60-1607(+)